MWIQMSPQFCVKPVWRNKNKQTPQSELMCVQCDARSLSGFRFKSSFQGRFLSISLHVPGGMLTVAALSDLASVFTTPGAQVTPLPASYGNILTHLSLEIRLVACFHTEICFVTKVTFLGCLAKKKRLHQVFRESLKMPESSWPSPSGLQVKYLANTLT